MACNIFSGKNILAFYGAYIGACGGDLGVSRTRIVRQRIAA